MKICVTGSTGFIGKNLLESLKEHEVYCYPRHGSVIDILDFNPEIIFHLAAEIYNEKEMFNSNIELTYKLLLAATKLNLKAFINVGSSSEYGRKVKPISETDHLVPTTLYESSKACASLLAQSCAFFYDIPIATVRLFSVYGKYEPNCRLIPTIYNNSVDEKETKLYNGVHDFIYIKDVIDALILIANSDKDKIKGDIINLGTGVETSNLNVFLLYEELLEKKLKIKLVPENMRIYDSNKWCCDTSYIESKYNFKCKYNFKEGLDEYIRERRTEAIS